MLSDIPIDITLDESQRLIVVSFRKKRPTVDPLGGYWDKLLELIRAGNCDRVAFDLTKTIMIPTGLISFILTLRKYNVEVHLSNCNEAMLEGLRSMNLDDLFMVNQLDI